MGDLSMKDSESDSYQEANIIAGIQSAQEKSQGPKAPVETEQKDYQQSEKLPSNSDFLDLLSSFEKMKIEEQRLLEMKQQILARQYTLRNKLVEEIEKKKESIANLNSEIPDLENRNKQVEQALDVNIKKSS